MRANGDIGEGGCYRHIGQEPGYLCRGWPIDSLRLKARTFCAHLSLVKIPASKHCKLIPPEIKWDPDATPPQYTDNGDQVIEKGTNLRIKLIGLRNDVRNMFAIGSIKEDYLGYGQFELQVQ